MSEAMEIVNSVAHQLHTMKPDHWRPGIDVSMETIPDLNDDHSDLALVVSVRPLNHKAIIGYDRYWDTYAVVIVDALTNVEMARHGNIHCDQLGELVFGDEAKPWSLPFFKITDADRNVVSEG